MKKLNIVSILIAPAALFVSVILSFGGLNTVFAATTPTLGTASPYSVLGSTYTNTSATTVNGEVGFTTGPAVNPAGTHVNYGAVPPYSTAGADQGVALSALASQGCSYTFLGGAVDLSTDTGHGPIGVYTPGVYCSTGAMDVGGAISLNGSGTYIFRSGGALTSTTGSIVTLSGASECDVFWTAAAATSLANNTTFVGTVIDDAGITVGAVVTWVGRALAFNGTVTTDTDTISVPSCATPPVPSVPPVPPVPPTAPAAVSVSFGNGEGTNNSRGNSGYTHVTPFISITNVPSPSSLPRGPGSVTYDYSVANTGTVQALTGVVVTDNMCNPIVFVSGDLNGNNKLDLTEVWKYKCTTTLSDTTTNTAMAVGYSDDSYRQSAVATAVSNVVVGVGSLVQSTSPVNNTTKTITIVPTLPDTGFPPYENNLPWNAAILIGILALISANVFLFKKIRA
ncbi:MAG: ice-binding family protein [Candidatus Taylorbacteria bacterium]|nr:ice-binding family protein [Candidatus Taylorbacteria bacterium]